MKLLSTLGGTARVVLLTVFIVSFIFWGEYGSPVSLNLCAYAYEGIPGDNSEAHTSGEPLAGELMDDTGEVDPEEERIEIPDPLEPFNRVMFAFNDKLYFYVLKPIAQGYRKVLPEKARVGVKNFFFNVMFPVRFINCLLQGNAEGVAAEFARFTTNTVFGLAGFIDFASREDVNIPRCEEDFGQTLGYYGLGPGFYINWPFLGPSSPRDTIGWIGDSFLYPFQYVKPWYLSVTTKVYDKVNETSLRIGDYEALKEAALDPYIAVRDAYAQYRYQKIKERMKRSKLPEKEDNAP